MENFGKVIAWIIALIISPIINGFVLVKMWAWFIIDTFNAQPLRIVEAIGLMYVIGFLTIKPKKNKEDTSLGDAAMLTIFKAAFYLFAGSVVSKFM